MVSRPSKDSVSCKRNVKLTSLKKAKDIARITDNKNAKNIVILDLRRAGFITDFFVIVSGTSDTHINAIADSVERELKIKGEKINHIEKDTKNTWVLLDYIDVVIHIFHEETRKYYNLERLWGDTKIIRWQEKKLRKY